MADAPKSDGGGGLGFIEITVGILILMALLSGALKNGNSGSSTNTNDNPNALTSTLGTDGSCAIVLDSPIGFQYVGQVSMKVRGKLTNCVTSDNQTAFFLQVFDANNVPVSESVGVPIIENKGTEMTFNTTFVFNTLPRTNKGSAVFTPNVPNISTSNALHVPVVFRK